MLWASPQGQVWSAATTLLLLLLLVLAASARLLLLHVLVLGVRWWVLGWRPLLVLPPHHSTAWRAVSLLLLLLHAGRQACKAWGWHARLFVAHHSCRWWPLLLLLLVVGAAREWRLWATRRRHQLTCCVVSSMHG